MPSLVEQVQAHLGPHATFATTIPQFHDVLFATKGTATLLELGIVAATSISCLRLRPDEFSLVWAEMTSHCKEIAEEDRKFRQRDGQEDLVNVSARQVMFEKYWQAASSHSESHNSRGWERSSFARRFVRDTCHDMMNRAGTVPDVDVVLFLAQRDFDQLTTVYEHCRAIEAAHNYIGQVERRNKYWQPTAFSAEPDLLTPDTPITAIEFNKTVGKLNFAMFCVPLETLVNPDHPQLARLARLVDLTALVAHAIRDSVHDPPQEVSSSLDEIEGAVSGWRARLADPETRPPGLGRQGSVIRNHFLAGWSTYRASKTQKKLLWLLFSEYHVYAKQYVLRACSDMLRRAKTLRDVDMKLFLAARDWQEHVRVGSLRSYRYGSILSNVYLRALAVEVAHSYISKHYPHHQWHFTFQPEEEGKIVTFKSLSVFSPQPRSTGSRAAARWA